MTAHWKELTLRGKKLFHQQQYQKAITQHWEALDYATHCFPDFFQKAPENATAMVLVSYLNLIDSYEATQQRLRCEELFNQSYSFFDKLNLNQYPEAQQTAVLRTVSSWRKSRCEYLDRVGVS